MSTSENELNALGEFGLIHHLTRELQSDPDLIQGVGDDCAVLGIGEEQWLVSTDAVVEGVHFDRDFATMYDIGWKSAAAAVSDIAAMGGIPRFVLVSMAIPRNAPLEEMEQLYRGISDLVKQMQAVIVGGDTTRSPDRIFIDFTVIGVNGPGRCLLRSGSRPGDVIAVTGYPGDSAAGLLALQKNVDAPELRQAHLHPSPRCAEGQWLSLQQGVHAMIDLSDGLLQDCDHLAQAARLHFHLESNVLPVSPYLQQYADALEVDPLLLVLSGGEAYELIFTMSPGRVTRIQQEFEARFNLPCSLIGKVSRSEKVGVQVNGDYPEQHGFDHFRS